MVVNVKHHTFLISAPDGNGDQFFPPGILVIIWWAHSHFGSLR